MSKNSKYYKLTLNISGDILQENAIALINIVSNFESVLQEDNQLIISYMSSKEPKGDIREKILQLQICEDITIEDELEKNWNAVYEKSFQPITILGGKWGVRASFHPELNVKNEIIIDPKMSFGTGHHETTKQVMEMVAQMNFKDKTIWDYGCGTGILAIMADKLEARSIKANDNEEWAYKNSLENIHLNNCANVSICQGDIEACESNGFINPKMDSFDIIIANITKNILLESAFKIDQYSHSNSSLVLSGFYECDIEDILNKYSEYNFAISSQTSLNNWACLHLTKN